MIKRFCDICGAEITPKLDIKDDKKDNGNVTVELKRKANTLRIEFNTYLNGDRGRLDFSQTSLGSGDFCKYCIIDAFKRWDDRGEVVPDSSYQPNFLPPSATLENK